MAKILITGGGPLSGDVWISGADGVHFEAVVISPEFEGQGTLQRHRRVYGTLGERMGGEIHALSLKTFTPEEWRRAGRG